MISNEFVSACNTALSILSSSVKKFVGLGSQPEGFVGRPGSRKRRFCLVCRQNEKHMLCAEEGDLRLVARRELNGYTVGALQAFVGGAFGTVCGAFFSNSEADVACRQLGFVGGGISPFADEALTEAELVVRPCPRSR